MEVPQVLIVAVTIVGAGRALDFGIRRWQRTVWQIAHEFLWVRVSGFRPVQMHRSLIKWIDRYLNHKKDSREEDWLFVAGTAFMCFSCLLGLFFVTVFLWNITENSEAENWPVRQWDDVVVLGWTMGISLVHLVAALMLFLFFMFSGWTSLIDKVLSRGKESGSLVVRGAARFASPVITGSIYGTAIALAVSFCVSLAMGIADPDFRAPVLAVLINTTFDVWTFGATAWFIKVASRGGAWMHLVCGAGDVVVAAALAFGSYIFMNFTYGWMGYRWEGRSPMNGMLVVLTITALVPTVIVVCATFLMIMLSLCQSVVRLVAMYSLDLAAHPDKKDEALPFTALGFLLGASLCVIYGVRFFT